MKKLIFSLLLVSTPLMSNTGYIDNNIDFKVRRQTLLKKEQTSQIYESGVLFIKHQEKLKLKPYRGVGGEWTIGYGHVIKKNESYLMKGITKNKALELLNDDFNKYVKITKQHFPNLKEDTKIVVVTLISYNLGDKFIHQGLGKSIRNNKDIKYNLLQYNKVNGKELSHLTKRRLFEYKLWTSSPYEFINQLNYGRINKENI
jgi:lysozyme